VVRAATLGGSSRAAHWPDWDIAMPQRFESYVFSPRANKLVREAFEAAWPKAALLERDRELTRQLLASAIIDRGIARR
jgi:hypothetical protein